MEKTMSISLVDTVWFLLWGSFAVYSFIKTTLKSVCFLLWGSFAVYSFIKTGLESVWFLLWGSFAVYSFIKTTLKIGSFTMPLANPTQKISNIEEEEEEEEEEDDDVKRWSDAPEDILLLIKSKLNFVDQLQFGAVCCAWDSLPDTSRIGELPWILGMRRDPCGGLRACGLYDPSSEKNYSFDHQMIMPRGDEEHELRFALCSKQGWVFLCVMSCDIDECKCLLFNAFSMKTIHLPDLKIEGLSQYTTAEGTFSTVPTCSDCIFYLTLLNYEEEVSDEIVLFTYSYGNETWNTVRLSIRHRAPNIRGMICMNNLLYFTVRGGEIWAFDIANEGEWGQIHIDCSAIDTSGHFRQFGLVEYKKEMLLVSFVLGRSRTYNVYEMDWSRKTWVEQVTELSNVALFMSEGNDVSHAVSVTSDYDDQKLNSLRQQIYVDGDAKDYHGHGRDFYFQPYVKGYWGLERLTPECADYMVWVRPQ